MGVSRPLCSRRPSTNRVVQAPVLIQRDDPVFGQIGAAAVMVDDVDGGAVGHAFERDQRLGVDQGDGFDVFSGQVGRFDKGQFRAVQVEEVRQLRFMRRGSTGMARSFIRCAPSMAARASKSACSWVRMRCIVLL